MNSRRGLRNIRSKMMKDEFEKLYAEDQRRIKLWGKYYSDKKLHEINKRLRKKLEHLIKHKKSPTGRQCFIAAMIMHHGFTIPTSKKALRYERLARNKGYKKQKWLIASIADRLLQLQGKPQKFGTQIVKTKTGKIKQYKTDNSVTDKERRKYGLPTLKQLKRYLEN